jgi:hypothetical protein
MKTRNWLALGLLALACLPSTAAAHTGAATVSCTGAQYSFARFEAGSNTVHYRIAVDNTTLTTGTFVLDESGGSAGHLAVPFTLYGTHEVQAFAWWGPQDTVNGETRPASSGPLADTTVHCAAAPPATSPVTPAPAPSQPVALPAPAASPLAPTVVVAGARETAPVVRVHAQRACTALHARITVTAPSMRRVRFSVQGRRPRTVTVDEGARRVTALVALRRHGPVAQRVTTRITFRNGAPERTLVSPVRRCSRAAVQPKFTG